MTPGHGHGLVVGKFYPPHDGHLFLLRTAAAASRRLTVLVEGAAVESIGVAERVGWLRTLLPDPHVAVVGTRCDAPMDLDSDVVWRTQVEMIRAALRHHRRPPVTALFSSEDYGVRLAAELGAASVQVDVARAAVPVSGTAVRAALAGHWTHLPPAVRAGLVSRVVVVGADSTGTTTVARALAERYRARGGVWSRTAWVPEYGRAYSEQLLARLGPAAAMGDVRWRPEDFARIAAEQNRRERAAAGHGSPLLVCDTDAFATLLWERRYVGGTTAAAAAAGPGLPCRRRAVYLVTDHVGVPFEQDGLRDEPDGARERMTGWFVDALTAAGHGWVLLGGTLDERLRLAERVTEQLLRRTGRFADPP